MVCTWLTAEEFELFAKNEDEVINEVLQQVRKIDPKWYVFAYKSTKGFFKKETETRYVLYERTQKNYSEVRIQSSINSKSDLLNFLFGLNLGLNTKPSIGL